MSVVGEFPGVDRNRRVIPSTPNPLDKSTVVSIYPKEINEVKHTISPGKFHIGAGTLEKPAILVIGPSSWWKETGEDEPILEIPQSSIQVADSIVKDYCNGILGCNMGDRMPGLFYIPGEYNVERIKKEFATKLAEVNQKQRNWFAQLVKIADALWARSNGNPLTISDDARMAARELALDKDWMKDYAKIEMVRCIACGALRNPEYPICGECHAIVDKEKAAKLGLTFAQ